MQHQILAGCQKPHRRDRLAVGRGPRRLPALVALENGGDRQQHHGRQRAALVPGEQERGTGRFDRPGQSGIAEQRRQDLNHWCRRQGSNLHGLAARGFKDETKRAANQRLFDSSPFSLYDESEECSTVRGVWTPIWTPGSSVPFRCQIDHSIRSSVANRGWRKGMPGGKAHTPPSAS